MKQVTIFSPTPQKELEKALLSKNYSKPVVLRMGSAYPTPTTRGSYVEINKYYPVLDTLDRLKFSAVLNSIGLCVPRNYVDIKDVGYPHILKRSKKIHGLDGVFYNESATDFKMAKGLLKGEDYVLQYVIFPCEEYRLFCTKKKCFLCLQRVADDADDEAMIFNNYNSSFKLAKVDWFLQDLERYAVIAMNKLDLDIAAFDVGIRTTSSSRYHFFFKATTNPLLTKEILPIYLGELNKLIKNELQ